MPIGHSVHKQTIAVVALAIMASGCNPFVDEGALNPMTLEPIGGGTVIVRRGDDDIEVSGRFSVRPRDEIITRTGEARLQLSGDRSAQIAPASTVVIVDETALETTAGSVLADAGSSMSVTFDDVTAVASAALFRIDVDLAAARAAALEGELRVRAPGQAEVSIQTLFEASVAAREVLDPEPYHLDDADPWDRVYLGEIVDLDQQLQRFARALSGQLGSNRPTVTYFESLAGGDLSFMRPYLEVRGRPAGDLAIALTIAELDRRMELPRAFAEAFRLHDRGGAWGVIASIREVEPRPLLARLETFIEGVVATRPPTDAFGDTDAGPSGAASDSADGDGRSDGSDTPSEGDGGSGGGSGKGGSGGGPDDCENLIDCTIEDLPTPPVDLP